MLPADVDEDDRDVVGRAAVERLLEQVVGGASGREAERERLRRVRVVDDTREPVRAEQPPVAGLRRHDERVELGVGVHVAEHAHEHRAPRVVPRLLRRDAARVDQALHERVVGRDLRERVVAVEVDARIADVRDDRVVVDHDERADGRSHAGELGLDVHGVDQLGRGIRDRVAQRALGRRGGLERAVEALEARDREARGDVAAGVPAHAVGDGEQVRAGVAGVLIVGAHLAGVRDGGARALEDHVSGVRYFRSSKVVAPTLIGAPTMIGHRSADASAVVPRAVRRVEVLDHPLLAPQHQARVVAGGVVVADHEARLARAPDRERLGAERQLEAGLRSARDDDARDGVGRRQAALRRRDGRGLRRRRRERWRDAAGAGAGGAAARGSGIRRTFTPKRSARSE